MLTAIRKHLITSNPHDSVDEWLLSPLQMNEQVHFWLVVGKRLLEHFYY